MVADTPNPSRKGLFIEKPNIRHSQSIRGIAAARATDATWCADSPWETRIVFSSDHSTTTGR
jgi:hypothetical protein